LAHSIIASGGDEMSNVDTTVGGLVLELRRGAIVLSVLSQLEKPQYGYSLVGVLENKGFSIDPGTLYPLLRRLEKQGLLQSEWDTNEARPRKYYVLSEEGHVAYRELCAEWNSMVRSIQELVSERG
jgi:DNA-binding PadR family transcriptional regulator